MQFCLCKEKNEYFLHLSCDTGLGCMQDVIPGPDETRPEVIVGKQLMLQDMEKLLTTLSAREEYIIRLHYGLAGERIHSCEEIGRLLNLSRERIRQIHRAALTRLREEEDLIESLRQNLT